jgi:hypothetical protein
MGVQLIADNWATISQYDNMADRTRVFQARVTTFHPASKAPVRVFPHLHPALYAR